MIYSLHSTREIVYREGWCIEWWMKRIFIFSICPAWPQVKQVNKAMIGSIFFVVAFLKGLFADFIYGIQIASKIGEQSL